MTSDDVQFGAFELRMSHAMQDFLGRAGLRVWAWIPAKETALEFIHGQMWRPYPAPVRLHDSQANELARWLERIAITGRSLSNTLKTSCEDNTRLDVQLSAEFSLEQIVGISWPRTPLLSRITAGFRSR